MSDRDEPAESSSSRSKPSKRKTPPVDKIHVERVKATLPVIEANAQTPIHVPTPPRPGMFRDDGSLNVEGFLDILGSDIRRKILSKLAKFPRYLPIILARLS